MTYNLLIPPFKIQTFSEMSKQEAQHYFDWFVQEIPYRLKNLQEYIKDSGENKIKLDFSSDSLKPLWQWLVKSIQIKQLSEDEIEAKKNRYPVWIGDFLKDYTLTLESLHIITDVSIYFGEVFVNTYDECKWGFVTKPKSYAFVNRPVVMGFGKDEMNPMTVVENLCHKFIRGESNENALYDLFLIWRKYIK